MESIYQKAQQEQSRQFYQEIRDKLEPLPPDTPDWKNALKNILDDLTQSGAQPSDVSQKKNAWDFSKEKSQTVFGQDGKVILCPITLDDADFYCSIRVQYSLIYRSEYYTIEENRNDLFLSETLNPETFFCIIRSTRGNIPIGYLGIKDTSTDLWELAIELDKTYTRRGLGPQSICLFLNKIQCITGRGEFQARIEVDNIPSQKCFERLGAQLVGLCNSVVLKTDAEKENFEKKNLNLIDTHMIELAQRIQVEPRKLLSHVLDYRVKIPFP